MQTPAHGPQVNPEPIRDFLVRQLRASQRSQYTNNLTPFGGSDFRTPFAQPGTLSIGTTLYAIPPGQDGTHLTPGSFTANTVNLADQLIPSAYGCVESEAGCCL